MKIFEVQILSYHAINAISICSQGKIIYEMLVTGVEGVTNCVGDKFELLVTVLAPKIGSRDRPYRS